MPSECQLRLPTHRLRVLPHADGSAVSTVPGAPNLSGWSRARFWVASKDGCIARIWNWICCPSCDYVFSLKAGAAAGSPVEPPRPAAGPAALGPAIDLAKLFADMDKFTSHVLSVPGAADNHDIKAQLDFVSASKEKLKVTSAEELASRTAVMGQLAALKEKNKQQREAQLQKIEEMKKPLPPLDGDALGRSLLKNLGIIE